MFNINELLEKIALGEDSTIEFKRELGAKTSNKVSMGGEITAFANHFYF
jgi:predicted HTH transcriptional regulator